MKNTVSEGQQGYFENNAQTTHNLDYEKQREYNELAFIYLKNVIK